MPHAIRSRTLHVQVCDAAWRRELERLKPQILHQLAAVLPSEPIDAISFRAGPSPQRPLPAAATTGGEPGQPSPASPTGPLPEMEDLSVPLQLVLDPSLRDMLQRVVGRYLVRSRRLVS